MIKISKSRVFHGGPTSGKTSFTVLLRKVGIDVIDTDDLIEELCPEFYKARLWRLREENFLLDKTMTSGKDGKTITPRRVLDGIGEARDAAVFYALGDALRDRPSAVAFTNLWLWRPHHIALLPRDVLIDGKIPISFFVSDTSDLVSRSKVRDGASGGIPLPLARKWLLGWDSHAKNSFHKLVPLAADEFIGNVSDFSDHPIIGPQWGKIQALMAKEFGDSGHKSEPEAFTLRPKCNYLLENGFSGAVFVKDEWKPVKSRPGETPFKACVRVYDELAPNSEPHNSVWRAIHIACGTARAT